MSDTVRALLERALTLPPARRAELARELIASLEVDLPREGGGEDDPGVARAWRDELARRVQDVEQGRVRLVPSTKAHGDARP